ncbi:unnamed protein product [Natator depressus]
MGRKGSWMEAAQDLQCLRPHLPSSVIAASLYPCTPAPPQAPWIQRGTKMPKASEQGRVLASGTRLNLTYSQERPFLVPFSRRPIFMCKCLRMFVGRKSSVLFFFVCLFKRN